VHRSWANDPSTPVAPPLAGLCQPDRGSYWDALCWSFTIQREPIVWDSNFAVAELTLELRQNRRYRLTAPISFSWESPQGALGMDQGSTRDISIAGVFILTKSLLPVGSLLRMDVTLPPLHPKSQRVHIRTQGHVVRSQENGFAAIANIGFRMDFHDIETGGHKEQGRAEQQSMPP
jgi:hypothetical protein